MALSIFENLGEKSYLQFEKMNFENDKKIRSWLELSPFERDIWQKLAIDIVDKVAQHFEENYNPDEPEIQINNIISIVDKNKKEEKTQEPAQEPEVEIEKVYIDDSILNEKSDTESESSEQRFNNELGYSLA